MKRLSLILAIVAVMLCASCNAESKEYSVLDYRTTMQFHDDFKILQLTDVHLGIESDLAGQLSLITDTIEKTDPDLIVMTGDNFMYGSKGIVYSLIKTLNDACAKQTALHPERLTKFAFTYGNHDNQGDYPRYFINDVIKSYATDDGREVEDGKYAAFIDYEDDDLFGLTNYFIDLVDDRSKGPDEADVVYRLHIIDSNTYHFTGFKYKYDVIHDEQLEHAKKIFQTATRDKDYIGMCFFHIPFIQYEYAKAEYENAADPSKVGQGEFREPVLYPYEDNGSYYKLRQANIISFIAGHNHKNYGDVIYRADSSIFEEKAILSFGVKSTNQLYHFEDMIGYKLINLKANMTKEQFLTIENLNSNFINVTDRYSYYG